MEEIHSDFGCRVGRLNTNAFRIVSLLAKYMENGMETAAVDIAALKIQQDHLLQISSLVESLIDLQNRTKSKPNMISAENGKRHTPPPTCNATLETSPDKEAYPIRVEVLNAPLTSNDTNNQNCSPSTISMLPSLGTGGTTKNITNKSYSQPVSENAQIQENLLLPTIDHPSPQFEDSTIKSRVTDKSSENIPEDSTTLLPIINHTSSALEGNLKKNNLQISVIDYRTTAIVGTTEKSTNDEVLADISLGSNTFNQSSADADDRCSVISGENGAVPRSISTSGEQIYPSKMPPESKEFSASLQLAFQEPSKSSSRSLHKTGQFQKSPLIFSNPKEGRNSSQSPVSSQVYNTQPNCGSQLSRFAAPHTSKNRSVGNSSHKSGQTHLQNLRSGGASPCDNTAKAASFDKPPYKSSRAHFQNSRSSAASPSYIPPKEASLNKIPKVSTPISKFPDFLLALLASANDWFGLVAHVVSPSEFYFHVACKDNEKIDEFHDTLNNFYQNSTILSCESKWKMQELVGHFCACYFRGDSPAVPTSGWYRAQVHDWLPSLKDEVALQLVDYGNHFKAKLADLQPLSKRFTEQPVFATRCHLSYLRPPQPYKEWPPATNTIFEKYLQLETNEIAYMISPTGKEETPPFSRHHDPNLNHEKSVPVILVPVNNSGSVNDYLVGIEFAEFDTEMEVRQVEAMESSYKESLRVKEMEDSKRKVEEWCTEDKVVTEPKRPAREPSPEFWLSSYLPEPKVKTPPLDEMDEWDPMKEDYENAEMNDEDACVAVTGYAPTDEMRVCRFFAVDGQCPWGSKCRREHVLSNIHGITTDKEEVFTSAFNELPMRTEGQRIFIMVTSAQDGYFYAIEQLNKYDPALSVLCDAINDCASIVAYKRLKVSPALGQIVLAKFSEDGRFYRARVIDGGDGSLSVFVFFVDFGNWELVSEKDLREVQPRFMHLAFQAIRCTLSNVKIFKEMYDNAARFLASRYAAPKVLEAEVVSRDTSTLNVLVTDEDLNDVGELMITEGFGSLVDLSNIIHFKPKRGNILPG